MIVAEYAALGFVTFVGLTFLVAITALCVLMWIALFDAVRAWWRDWRVHG